MSDHGSHHGAPPATLIVTASFATVLAVGVIDFSTGTEIRIYPLYFVPLSLAAWYVRLRWALLACLLATASWIYSNALAGQQYAHPGVWLVNALAQGSAFATVVLLFSRLRQKTDFERAVARERLLETQEKLAAESSARVETLDQLRHADKLASVGEFASGIAHELGTPLNIVSGRASIIAAGEVQEAEEVREQARIIAEQAQRMTRILRDLLDYARRGKRDSLPTDLCAVASECVSLLTAMARRADVALRLEPSPAPLFSVADSGQLQQALTNLIVNAIHATPTGGSVVVALRGERRAPPVGPDGAVGDHCRIDVVDTGCGMDAQTLGRVFEPFFTTKGIGRGTGLGLSVARGIVRDHGGWIDVESRPGIGTGFSIYLPRLREADVAVGHAPVGAIGPPLLGR